jgi:energy-converting hydrogenase Eha subunit C
LVGLLNRELLYKWTTLFLEYTVATGVTGLLFSIHHFMPVQKLSMLSVYASGIAVLAWRKFHLVGIWRSIFAFTTTFVLYLSVVVAINQAFELTLQFTALATRQAVLTFLFTQLLVTVLFVVIGILAVKRFHSSRSTHFENYRNRYWHFRDQP